MKKKLLAIVLCLALVASLAIGLAACNDNTSEFKIGVLHINPVTSTSGYTFAHQQGILYMQRELGLKDSQIVIEDSIDDTNAADINAAIERLIAAGCNMIIGTSFGYMEEMQEAAKNNPQIIFSHGTGYLDTYGEGKNNNMNNYFGRIYQARYLSGIVAGLKASQGGNVGYVVAHGNYIAECSSGVNAFALGVQSVNPEAKTHVMILGSWYDPTNEAAYAETLLNDFNCEVITQHCDTENPSAKAKAAGKYSIGYNSDMGLAVKEANEERSASVLTSVVWNWGVYYKAAVEAAMSCFDEDNNFVSTDNWKTFGNYYGSYADGLFDLAPLSSSVNADTNAILELVKSKMRAGTDSWDVFTNKKLDFTKVEGAWQVAEVDRVLLKDDNTAVGAVTVANITGDMPYWVKGVIVHTAE